MTGTYVRQFGTEGSGDGEFNKPEGIAVDSAGNLYVVDDGNARIEEFNQTGGFLASFGSSGTGEGQFTKPLGISINSAGDLYVTDGSTDMIQTWVPINQAAHNTKTIYYTAKTEATAPECQNHPEWAGLPCQTEPSAQPEANGSPSLPITTVKYSIWNQPEKITEVFPAKGALPLTTRTRSTTFDPVGRATKILETSSNGTSLPEVTNKYSTKTGALETQSTTNGEGTKTITSVYNPLGQLETYTDADGNVAKYLYDIDGRASKVSDSSNTGASNQTYSYDNTTGALTKLVDSATGTFTAAYDVQGKMTSENYPNGMTAYYTYNPAGDTTNLEYKKVTHCTEKCTWFSDSVTASIHGETMSQASTFATEPTYNYDAVGRLTQVQEIPTGEGCTTRTYAYDEEGDRTNLTTYKPNSKNECATEEGTVQHHTYDEADRLTDPGTTYEAFGNTTKLPASDAGESLLESSYYVDGQVSAQTQSAKTVEYKLDPAERTRATITAGKTAITHYDGPGNAIAWTAEESGKWTRQIPGIDGTLAAIQPSSGNIELQLHDLQGNVVATTGTSGTETELLKKYNSTEFGVPNSKEAPPKYAWLGADGVASEFPTGTITQDGITYVPQTGRSLQTGGVPLPSPENTETPFTRPIEAWVGSRAGEGAALEQGKAEARQKALELANQPPGVIPGGPVAGGAGGQEAFEESESLEGGCSGANACAASNTSCELRSLFGEPDAGYLWLAAGVKCSHKVSIIEVRTCFWVWNGHGSTANNEDYKQFKCNGNGGKGQTFTNTALGKSEILTTKCAIAWSYKAWVWGHAAGSNFWFVGQGKVSDTWVCSGDYTGASFEFGEFLAG